MTDVAKSDNHWFTVQIGKNLDSTQVFHDQMAISQALAQAVFLQTLEERTKSLFHDTSLFTAIFDKAGHLPIFQSNRVIAEVLAIRYGITMTSNLLGPTVITRDAVSSSRRYKNLSSKAAGELSIQTRIHTLNNRLDVLHELADHAYDDTAHAQSLFYERVIVALLFVEVAFGLYNFIYK